MRPLLQRAAAKSGGSGNAMSCSRAAIINITSKVGSVSDNSGGKGYAYRSSKVSYVYDSVFFLI